MPSKMQVGVCRAQGHGDDGGRGKGQVAPALPELTCGAKRSHRDGYDHHQGDEDGLSIEERTWMGAQDAVSEILRVSERPGDASGSQGRGQIQAMQEEQGQCVVDSLSEFMWHDPPKFDGIDKKVAPEEFLEGCLKIGEALGCNQQLQVECAAFRLGGPARTWYKQMMAARPLGTPPLKWDEFSSIFREQFIPQIVRLSRAWEFENLRQMPNMSVEHYEQRFSYLSKYAPRLVATEEERVRHFVKGLAEPISNVIVTSPLLTYDSVVKDAMMIEKKAMEEQPRREQQKKANNETIGHGSSGQQRRLQQQQQQHQRGVGSSRQRPKHINDSERVLSKVCRDWLSRECVRGEDCKYLHSWSCGDGFSMVTKLEGHKKAVKGIALPSGSNKLYTGCKDKTVRVWDCNTSQCVQVFDLSGEVGSLISEGPCVLVGLEGAIKVWNTQTGSELTLLEPVGLVRDLVTVDAMLFVATQDGTILVWKFRPENEPLELITSLKGHSGAVNSLTIAANKVYSGSMDNTIRVWDLSTLRCVQTIGGHTDAVTSVLWWDKYLLSCSLDGSIKAWRASEAGDMEVFYTHGEEHGFLSLCVLNDAEGKPILLCSCEDNYVSLYDLATEMGIRFAERGRLFARREVRAIQIGPAGTGLFFTGDATGQVTVWKLNAADVMQS